MFSCAKDETNSFRFHSLFVPENLQLQLTMISHSSHTEIGGLSRRFLFYIEVLTNLEIFVIQLDLKCQITGGTNTPLLALGICLFTLHA